MKIDQIEMLYNLHQWICLNKLYKLMESFLSNFKLGLVFKIVAKKRKIFKRIVRREYWSNCYVLYINIFALMGSSN